MGQRFSWRVGFWIAHGVRRTKDSLSESPVERLAALEFQGPHPVGSWEPEQGCVSDMDLLEGLCLYEVLETVAARLELQSWDCNSAEW